MSLDFVCPVCKADKYKSLCNNLHFCKSCSTVFNSEFKELKYDSNYFLNEYMEQYGKTYEEDFHNIYKISTKRLNNIITLLSHDNYNCLKLLDIGSALGFFLKCAKDFGIHNINGIEISEFACEYCKNNFNIHVENSSFKNIKELEGYNIITAWFFIEHCLEPVDVIKDIYDSLLIDGIFAFSTPSIFGPHYILNKNHWIKSHPSDHMVDFSPSGIKKILKEVGFKRIIIKPSGFHPERVISKESVFFKAFSIIFKYFSNLTSFSDTVEVYAIK